MKKARKASLGLHSGTRHCRSIIKMSDIFSFLVEGIFLTIVSLFGLIGNLLSIVVLTRSIKNARANAISMPTGVRGHTTFPFLLRGLASFDALFLAAAIASFGLPNLSSWYTDNIFMRLMATLFGLVHTFRTGSVYITLAVTFERFHSIVCPLKEMKFKRGLLAIAVLFSIIYNIPKYFEMVTKQDPKTKLLYIESTELRQNPTYISLYVFWSKLILVELIPYISIVFMNVVIILKLSKSQRFRSNFYPKPRINKQQSTESTEARRAPEDQQQLAPEDDDQNDIRVVESEVLSQEPLSGKCQLFSCFPCAKEPETSAPPTNSSSAGSNANAHAREEKSLSFILITMSAVFIVCQSLKIVPDLYELFVCKTRDLAGHHCKMDGPVINGIVRISHFMVCVNSTANFLIYYVYGSKFRKAWVQTYEPYYKRFITFFESCRHSDSSELTEVSNDQQPELTINNRSTHITVTKGTELSSNLHENEIRCLEIITDRELEKFAKFRALHGPTMV